MEHPTKQNLEGLIYYIKNLDIKQIEKKEKEQREMVQLIFESQTQEDIVFDSETKQVLIDEAYLSWLLFMKKDLDVNSKNKASYDNLLKKIDGLKRLWYTTKLRPQLEQQEKKAIVITLDEMTRDFPGALFKVNQPDISIVFTSLVIAMDYKMIVNTLARKDL
jgi:hypothetical protein